MTLIVYIAHIPMDLGPVVQAAKETQSQSSPALSLFNRFLAQVMASHCAVEAQGAPASPDNSNRNVNINGAKQ